ncbi:hypothetical protein BC749_101773 [Flavobacterium araucananum]|uniref:Uncharacterized protein n=1 Tax=Flavobacterium araucananum TaxID=946678 RepID=A0A227PJ75_9FLAO|nr:hypothetical protein [Flavobacterium araucananum]OXG09328.1 hypothetical protein B0A64_00760 [Flavobacterium araucananum]PWK02701.1 hypothetical protein BC749_101773 [Flavobacterium araucananum]
MGAVAATSTVAYFLEAVSAAVANLWNPGGWIALAIIAVVAVVTIAYIYRKEIAGFFYSIGSAIADTAKIMWDYVVTIPTSITPPAAVDDVLPLPIVAPPGTIPLEETKPITIAPPITTTKPRTRKRDKDDYNVYDLHVGRPGYFRDYTWGAGHTETLLNIGAIWKYGLTSFKSVYARYLIISELYPNEKESYILLKLTALQLLPKQWYLQNASYATANVREVELIDTYVSAHGKLPPGNTFRG